MANHILIPKSRADAILDEVGTVPPGEDGMTGSWNLDVMLKSGSRHIANDIAQILENHAIRIRAPERRIISTLASTGAIPAPSSAIIWTPLW